MATNGKRQDDDTSRDTSRDTALDRGPGASSGSESQPKDRVIPGMGSASEGYESEPGGTRRGDPLEGIKLDDEDDR
ncbi:hypothetical protein [Spirillospora sp. NPDC047279]|uniref:hypothetical protein n=1 Tax=Spirillospora sp. NPDC047279 TaxID=3155478 RepID=UPI0033C09941